MRNTICIFFIFLFLYFLTGCQTKTPKQENIVNIEALLDKKELQLRNLSDFGKRVRYIPLELTDESLVGRPGDIFLFEDHIYIIDGQQFTLLHFKTDGSFQGTIGRPGGGPGEYVGIPNNVEFLTDKNILSMKTTYSFIYQYTPDGKFIRKITLPSKEDHHIASAFHLGDDYILGDLITAMQTKYNYLIYNHTDSTIQYVEVDPEPMPKSNDAFSSLDMAIMWKYDGKVRYMKRAWNTVITFDESLERDTLFQLNYGRYSAMDSDLEQFERFKRSVYIQKAKESKDHIFLEFQYGKWAPETFEKKYITRDGEIRTFISTAGYALYDKQTKKMQLLKKPVEKAIGLNNDIDDGPVFWPQYIDEKGRMIMYFSAFDLLNAYEQLENPPAELARIMQHFDEESNPVVMIVE